VRELVPLFVRHLPPPWGLAAHWWASVYHDTVSRLGQIQAPTLVMHGERDGMAPVGVAHLLAERIPDARLEIIPGAGHAFALEAPEESLETCLAWLEERASIGPGAPRTGLAARAEPLTRALGLHIGALRTGRSLLGWGLDAVRGPRDAHEDGDGRQ
jgi:acetyl esterase/lipase